jgi:predicted transcriptional regulator
MVGKNMQVTIPGNREEGMKCLSTAIRDNVSKVILEYVIKNHSAYLNGLTRELTDKKIASRRTVYEHLLDLEDAGILESAMKKVELGNPCNTKGVKAWVRQYGLTDQHKDWVTKLLSD